MCSIEICCSECKALMHMHLIDCFMTKTHKNEKIEVGICSVCVGKKIEETVEATAEDVRKNPDLYIR